MRATSLALFLGLAQLASATGSLRAQASAHDASDLASAASPVEKVITMLEDLQVQVINEGKAEAKTYDSFACFCKDVSTEKSDNIADGQNAVDTLTSTIGSLTADRNAIDDEISEHNDRIQELNKLMEDSKAARHKENEEFMVLEAELSGGETNLHAAGREIHALMSAISGASLAQRRAVFLKIRHAMNSAEKLGVHRRRPAALLQEPDEGHGAANEELLETVEDLETDFHASLEEVLARERKAVMEHNHYIEAKMALRRDTEQDLKDAQEARGAKSEGISSNSRELTSTAAVLADDKAYLLELTAKCEAKAKTWDQRSRVRTDELTALTTALHIIKEGVADKALVQLPARGQPVEGSSGSAEESRSTEVDEILAEEEGASFLQLGDAPRQQLAALVRRASTSDKASTASSTETASTDALKERAVALLRSRSESLKSTTLAKLASVASGDPFAKVKKMVQELVERLLQEAADEASHKGWCDKELGKAKARRTRKAEDIKKLNSALATGEAKRDKLTEKIDALTSEISELEDVLVKTTKERSVEKAENAETIKEAEDGKKAVEEATTTLERFYKTAAKELIQTRASKRTAEEPDGGPDENYQGNQAAAGGILGMMDVIRSDFVRTISTTEAQETQAQKDFLEFSTTTKVSLGTKKVGKEAKESELTDTKAKIAEDLQSMKDEQALFNKALQELIELRPACIDTGMSYEEKVAKREQELESLKQALCILDSSEAGCDSVF